MGNSKKWGMRFTADLFSFIKKNSIPRNYVEMEKLKIAKTTNC